MENNILMENQPVNEAPKRPQFVTVLCFLSFMGSVLYFIWSIWGYASITASGKFIEKINDKEVNTYGMINGFQEAMIKAYENAIPNLIIGLLCSIICFYGVLKMWKLKKTGFFIYSIGEVTPAIAGFFLGGGGLISGTGAVLELLLAIVWIVLYAINFKHFT
ncbi:MAG: hypothetical protein KAZ71_01850 [Bacteroidia bacterium]|nr:hypothetical protein [Bacteroidia bacterium]